MNCKKIIAGIYACEENFTLIKVLENNNVQVMISEIDDVNARFINMVLMENVDYVIRVGGDQVLCDSERINRILEEMQKGNYDWFWEAGSASILPDIIRKDVLVKYEKELLQGERYFEVLKGKAAVMRYSLEYPCILPFNFRVDSNEGFRICKKIIQKNMNVYDLSKKLASRMMHKNNYLFRTGIMGSWLFPEEYFIDEEQEINPWWARDVIDFLKPRLNKNMRVFEWGAGNSTLFWSQHVKEVVAIEYDHNWYKKIKKELPSNVRLKYFQLEYNGAYCRSILEEKNKFDIVLIDGRDRVRCASYAVERLKDNGIIIWDNSDREYYQDGYKFLEEKGFKRIELSGLIYAAVGVENFTSIFYKTNNILEL